MYTLLSKRKLKYFVENGQASGWDDPRFPTIRGIMRRGLSKEALVKFILQQGPSQNNLLLEWDKIWAINKKELEPNSARHTALVYHKLVHAKIVDSGNAVKSAETVQIPKNKKKPDMGTNDITYSSDILLDHSDVEQMIEGEEVSIYFAKTCVLANN